MSLKAFVSAITDLIAHWPDVIWFLSQVRGKNEADKKKLRESILAASALADKGDTSGYENLLRVDSSTPGN